jgi:hypothetical protein
MVKQRYYILFLLFLAMSFTAHSQGSQDFYVAKLEKNGDLAWQLFPPSTDFWDKQLLLCADKYLYLAGEHSILRIDENGAFLWSSNYSGEFGNLSCDEEGGIVLLSSTIEPTKVATILRYTASGDLTINIDYQSSQQCDFRGEFYRINETTNAMILKMNEQKCTDELIVLDSEMNEKWRLEGNNSDADWKTLIRVLSASDGSIFLLSEGEDGAMMQKSSENGEILWSLPLPFKDLYPTKTAVDATDNVFIMAAQLNSSESSIAEVRLLEINKSGDLSGDSKIELDSVFSTWNSVLIELTTNSFFIGGFDEAEFSNSEESMPIRIQEYSLEGLLMRDGDLITNHPWLNLVAMTVGREMEINILAEGGYFSNSEAPITNIIASKMNVDGNMQWIYEYDCGDQLVDVPYYLQNDSQSGIYFNGIVCRENDEPNFDDDTADDDADDDANEGCGC